MQLHNLLALIVWKHFGRESILVTEQDVLDIQAAMGGENNEVQLSITRVDGGLRVQVITTEEAKQLEADIAAAASENVTKH